MYQNMFSIFDAQEIIQGMYLGSIDAAQEKELLDEKNITHILAIAKGAYPKFPENFKYLTISVLDSPSQNLIQHFDECFQFIDSARNSGKAILVHCMAGISRSATVVIAYIMSRMQLTFFEATAIVKSARRIISPNEGFTKQLLMFERMQFSINGETEGHSEYKQFLLKQKLYEISSTWIDKDGRVPIEMFGEIVEKNEPSKIFTCNKCQSKLFTNDNIIETQSKIHNIEPMKWMAKNKFFMDDPRGSIFCNQCSEEVGTFSWLGNENNNETGIFNFGSFARMPYFHVFLHKVTETDMKK